MKSFFFKVSFVSYVLLHTDFYKKYSKNSGTYSFFQKMENLCMERVKHGRFINK